MNLLNQLFLFQALRPDMCIILKDQSLLFAFMQFLKNRGAVYILQFCLDVGMVISNSWSLIFKLVNGKIVTLSMQGLVSHTIELSL